MSPSEDRGVDPRILRTRRIVREAAMAELAARGFADFTIEAVAARAGVGKSTIYRHWRDHVDLLVDALETQNQQPAPRGEGETARDRVTALLHHLAESMSDPVRSAAIPALIEAGERHARIAAKVRAFSGRRRQVLVDAIDEGVQRGELPAHVDPELAALALSGALLYRRTMTDRPLPQSEVADLITTVFGPPRG